MDLWASRVQSAKHISAVQAARLSNSDSQSMDGGEDDFGAWFPCPFCYVEIEVPVLCGHLQEEHCFDLKNEVCPLCAATLGKDAIGHFTIQHSLSVKRRRNAQKSGFWSNTSSMINTDFRELASFIGSNPLSSRSSTDEAAPDPLLSPFLCNTRVSESEKNKLDSSFSYTGAKNDTESCKPCPSDPVKEQDYEERMQRASFFQELIMSTIF